MVRRLLAQGWQVVAWDADPARRELLPAGAEWGENPGAVRRVTDVLILCLGGDDALERTCLGDGGLASSRGAHIVIDVSATGVELTRSLGEGMDVAWLDCPADGLPEAAERGELTMMAGGTEDLFDWVRPVLADLGSNITLMGPLGAGQTAKLISQAIVGTNYVLMAEVLAQARASGIEAAKLVEALRGSIADSPMLRRILPQMAAGDFDPVRSRVYELNASLAELHAFNVVAGLVLPVEEAAIEQLRRFVGSGNAERDTAAVATLYQPDEGS